MSFSRRSACDTRQRKKTFLRGIYCHHVFDDETDSFRAIMESLCRVGTFVNTETCVAMLQGERPIDGRYFHLSFDDGFRNVFHNGIPILRELGIPAILFVPTAMMDADWAAARDHCLANNRYAAPIEMLTWDDLRKLQSWGYETGSHTRTHARFSELAAHGTLEEELVGSKSDIEAQLGTECKYISWPFGTMNDVDEESLAATRAAGYHACFGAFRGSVVPGATDRWRIPRHHFEAFWPRSHVLYFANRG